MTEDLCTEITIEYQELGEVCSCTWVGSSLLSTQKDTILYFILCLKKKSYCNNNLCVADDKFFASCCWKKLTKKLRDVELQGRWGLANRCYIWSPILVSQKDNISDYFSNYNREISVCIWI